LTALQTLTPANIDPVQTLIAQQTLTTLQILTPANIDPLQTLTALQTLTPANNEPLQTLTPCKHRTKLPRSGSNRLGVGKVVPKIFGDAWDWGRG